MDFKKTFSAKRVIFLAVFALMVFFGNKVNFSAVVGADNQYFTLFQFFGPIAGGFLGPIFGAVAVLIAQVATFFISHKALILINILRLTPMLFAAYYFGTKKKAIAAVPIACMVLFIMHPVGRQAWFYSLFWLIPLFGVLPFRIPGKLFFRSLGATFTAHAVGSTAWLYSVPMTASQWVALIPVVAYERIVFACGITVSYLVLNTALDKLVEKTNWKLPANVLCIDKNYVLSRRLFGIKA